MKTAKTKCLIFDSYYDNYKGAVAYVRVIDGTCKSWRRNSANGNK